MNRSRGVPSHRFLPVSSSLLLAPLILSGLSCADRTPGGTPEALADSAGIPLVRLPDPAEVGPPSTEALDTAWHPGRGAVIGNLLDLAILQDGRTVLLDATPPHILVFSRDGELQASFGSSGQGPGEFDPGGLSDLVATDSSLIVPDLHQQRITELTFEGDVLATRRLPLPRSFAVDWRRHPWGGLAFRDVHPEGDRLVRITGLTVDTLFIFPMAVDDPGLLLQPTALWDLTPEGDLVIARSDEPRVEKRAADTGQPIWIARRTDAGTMLSNAEKDHLLHLVTESAEAHSAGGTPELGAQILSTVGYPDRAPVFASMIVASWGDVWIRQALPVEAMDSDAVEPGPVAAYGGQIWQVLDPGGSLCAERRLPEGFSPRRLDGSWLYGIQEDTLGLAWAARTRVEPCGE